MKKVVEIFIANVKTKRSQLGKSQKGKYPGLVERALDLLIFETEKVALEQFD